MPKTPPPTIAILGAFDTKGADLTFLQAEIERRGCRTHLLDFSVVGEHPYPVDTAREQVAAAGGSSIADLVARGERGAAMTAMAAGATVIVSQLAREGKIDGIVSMGGGGGTSVATTAMRALPIGFPKLMVSTLASGDVSAFVGASDIVMKPSILDVSGVNRISRTVYTQAAGAIVGMVTSEITAGDDKPLIATTMFGNTTRAVNHAKTILEAAGYEVLVFHATGSGGRAMETLVRDGLIAGVLDMTTTEWADELLGGVLSAGSTRLDAAVRASVPQIVVTGCLDMCNFRERHTVPERYADRLFYEWNANITLMRTTVEENAQLGAIFAEKLNRATAAAVVYIPMRGWSEIDTEGKPFYLPEAIAAFTRALKADLRPDILVYEIDHAINDPEFAGMTAHALLEMLKG